MEGLRLTSVTSCGILEQGIEGSTATNTTLDFFKQQGASWEYVCAQARDTMFQCVASRLFQTHAYVCLSILSSASGVRELLVICSN